MTAATEAVRYGVAREHYAVLGSTNDRAAQWLREGGPHGLLVTADAQTAGRGRNARVWESPPGANIYASVGLRVPAPRPDFCAVGLAVGLAMLRSLPAHAELGLKWPNDVLVGERKLAGILCESRWSGEGVELVVGIGLNVAREGVAASLRGQATSMEHVWGVTDRDHVLHTMMIALQHTLESFLRAGFAPICAEYKAANCQLGHTVRVTGTRGAAMTGAVETIDANGGLVLRLPSGARHTVHAGDVQRVRASV